MANPLLKVANRLSFQKIRVKKRRHLGEWTVKVPYWPILRACELALRIVLTGIFLFGVHRPFSDRFLAIADILKILKSGYFGTSSFPTMTHQGCMLIMLRGGIRYHHQKEVEFNLHF